MSAPLVLKEVREHRWTVLAIAGLQALAVGAMAFDPSNARGSYLELVRRYTLGLSSVGAWMITQRVIAREYTSRTQLYLETLPVTRARVLGTKWVLGALVVLGSLAAVIAVAAVLAGRHEVVERHRLVLIAARAGSFALLVYAGFAAVALLGRYRVALALFVLFTIFFITDHTDVHLGQVGPALLVTEELAYVHHGLPVLPLLWTWGLTAGFAALAFALVLIREGSVQAMLAERMSHREKVFFGCVFVSLLVSVTVFDEVRRAKPFTIASGEVARREGIEVHVAVGSDADRPVARPLAEHEAALLDEVRRYLGLKELPAISLLPSGQADPDVFEKAKLEKRDGLVARARFDSPELDLSAFDAWLLEETIAWASNEQDLPEARQWVSEGFGWWWVSQKTPALARQLGVRARFGEPSPRWETLDAWLTTRERLGPCVSGAVAFQALEALRAQTDEARFQAFLRAALGWRSPRSVRALWRRRTVPALLREEAGSGPEQVVAAWRQALERDPQGLAGEVAALPRPSAELVLKHLGSSAVEARYRVSGTGAEPFTVLFTTVPPVNGPVDPGKLVHELNLVPDGQWHALPRTFAVGERLAWTVSTRLPALGCAAWTGLRREELR